MKEEGPGRKQEDRVFRPLGAEGWRPGGQGGNR